MWILRKAVKVKLAILDSKGKPIYEAREAGEPCPEASTWNKPLLWCRDVPDSSSDANYAIAAYKTRTGHNLGTYEAPKDEAVDAKKKGDLLIKLDGLKAKGSTVAYSPSETIVMLMKKVEASEKSLLPPSAQAPKENAGVDGAPASSDDSGESDDNKDPLDPDFEFES